jgi:hypothetical protein
MRRRVPILFLLLLGGCCCLFKGLGEAIGESIGLAIGQALAETFANFEIVVRWVGQLWSELMGEGVWSAVTGSWLLGWAWRLARFIWTNFKVLG